MDDRRRRLISYRNGYDIKDHMPADYRAVVARRIRKQEKRALDREWIDTHAAYDDLWDVDSDLYDTVAFYAAPHLEGGGYYDMSGKWIFDGYYGGESDES